MKIERFLELLRLHSTPGDEDIVRNWLTDHFKAHGWQVEGHGQYAITARCGDPQPGRPTILISAHMDSPGYTVEQIKDGEIQCVHLGGAHFPGDNVEAVLKTKRRQVAINLKTRDKKYVATYKGKVEHGDRVCHRSAPQVVCDKHILSPFIDNRVGCFVIAELAADPSMQDLPVNLVLGATSTEEMGGFGAPVLANAVKPELAICLDATYEAPDQNVFIGNGPVLTLSDASVILSPRQRDSIRKSCKRAGIPVQTEVYNFSGTDSRAFPHQGLECPVIALLIATTGNHSPVEKAAIDDIRNLYNLLKSWCLSANSATII